MLTSTLLAIFEQQHLHQVLTLHTFAHRHCLPSSMCKTHICVSQFALEIKLIYRERVMRSEALPLISLRDIAYGMFPRVVYSAQSRTGSIIRENQRPRRSGIIVRS